MTATIAAAGELGSWQKLPSARELVRENRRNSQDRVDAFPVDALWGGGFAYLIDKKARRMHLP
jgi:hypothetical protein